MNDYPSSAYGVIKLLPETKDQINTFSMQLINSVKNGEVNPLELKAYFKMMEKVVENVDKHIKENLMNEADRYSEKKFQAFGFEIEKTAVWTEYDYSSCGDIEWEIFDSQAKGNIERRKEREKFLRAMTKPITQVNEDTGEIYTVKPPIKKTVDGLKFTMK